MLATKTLLLHRSGPLAATLLKQQQPRLPVLLATKAFATTTSVPSSSPLLAGHSTTTNDHYCRNFSAAVDIKGTVSDGVSSDAERTQKKAGYVTRKLRVLDMDVVEKIKNELQAVDANSDGR